ncbi:MAG: AMP-binding protein [Bauldia sp.]
MTDDDGTEATARPISAADARPWLSFYGDVPPTLSYPSGSLHDVIAASIRRHADKVAFDFLGTKVTYGAFGAAIDRAAAGLAGLGMREGDSLLVSMPTSPHGIAMFYAALKLGGTATMIHPLSTPAEIAFYLKDSGSRFAVTLDAFYGKFAEAREGTPLQSLILARIPDYLGRLKRIGFWLKLGRKIPKVPADAPVVWWSQMMRREPAAPVPPVPVPDDALAVVLYSGGTTGHPKGVMLSHRNVIAEGLGVVAWGNVTERDTVLAALPIFHGFGLGALVNAPLMIGASVTLVPVFTPKAVADAIRRTRPTILAGVPTLFEALTRNKVLRRADLSGVRAAFSGGDTLPPPVKTQFEVFVAERGGRVKLLEGYGLTEAVTAVIATPMGHYREGSIGIPLPDILAKICTPETDEELSPGETGEICLSGPATMIGYLNDAAATDEVLRRHRDGRIWLRTGDLGHMDPDGFFHFTSRRKQLIKSSGFSVYPRQVEEVLYQHPAVREVSVIGVPDERQGERVKAVVAMAPGIEASEALKEELIGFCRERLIKWSCPREIAFLPELPKTRVGKIDLAAMRRMATEGPAQAS